MTTQLQLVVVMMMMMIIIIIIIIIPPDVILLPPSVNPIAINRYINISNIVLVMKVFVVFCSLIY